MERITLTPRQVQHLAQLRAESEAAKARYNDAVFALALASEITDGNVSVYLEGPEPHIAVVPRVPAHTVGGIGDVQGT